MDLQNGNLDGDDALEAFHSEADWPQDAAETSPDTAPAPGAADQAAVSKAGGISLPLRQPHRAPRVWVLLALSVVAIAEAPFVAMWFLRDAPAVASGRGATGTATVYVESEPSGAEVLVNGEILGHTPARLSLPRGTVELQLRHGGIVRVFPLAVNPEETMRLRVEFPTAAAPVSLPDRDGGLPAVATLAIN